ncbi:DUF3828 domain-containing protein [Pokkaliibacter sp. CJK22405]|uniref:DUF3828 domain-containing protein n=1 Tax=Pokkaliibacter sp. CJK22405 TaxID=3384615 RepID=UPI0039846496
MKKRVYAAVKLFFAGLLLLGQSTLAAEHASPASAVEQFYRGYVADFDGSNVDCHYCSQVVTTFVAPKTVARLQKVLSMPEQEILQADYFTYTQDYDPVWILALEVKEAPDFSTSKTLDVYLPVSEGKKLHLRVVVEDDQGWKIVRVRDETDHYEQAIFQ